MSLLCRACLVARESFTFVLFENVSAEEYSFCTSVEVNQDDELPKTICNICYELLEKYSNFKRACIQAQNTLMFQNNFNKTLPKEETWINGDDKFELDERCEVVMSESKLMMTQDDSSNDDEDVNTDNEYNRNSHEDYDHDNENYDIGQSGTTQMEDCIENDDDDDDEPLQELKKKIKCTISLLPEASKKMYIHAYESFYEWKNNIKATSLSEKVMLTYFRELSEKLKPSTLWSKFSMLRSVMLNNDNIDLKKYFKLLAFLKRQSKGFISKKPKALSANEIKRFIIEAPDDRYLATKVALIFGITGACNCNELIRITMKDIETHGEIILIKVPDGKGKTTRTFTIHGEYYKIVIKYMGLRLSRCNSDRFFQTYRKGKCVAQVIGKNKMGNMTKEIAMYLGLPDLDSYSGSSFKKASAMLLENSGLHRTSPLNRHDDRSTKIIAETCNQNPTKQTTHLKRRHLSTPRPSNSCASKQEQEQIMFVATSCAPQEPEQIFMSTSCAPKQEPQQIFMATSCAPQEPEQIFMATSCAPKEEPQQIFMATSCAPKQEPEQIFMASSCVPKEEPEQIFMASSCAPKEEPGQMSTLHVSKQQPEKICMSTTCAPSDQMFKITCCVKQELE